MPAVDVSNRARSGWRGWIRVQVARRRSKGWLLMVCAFGATVILAVWGSTKHPPSVAAAAVLTFAAGAFQFVGSLIFSADGKADPMLAQSSVSRLMGLLVRVKELTDSAERAYEGKLSEKELHRFVGEVSASASFIEESVGDAIYDWSLFHEQAVDRARTRGKHDDK